MTSIDDMLHREGPRHGTLGPTGKRLFTERLDVGLGIRGRFGYIHHGDIRDPIHLTLWDQDGRIVRHVEHEDWYPSHLVVRSRVGALAIEEIKYITDDDTFVDQLTLTNVSDAPISYRLRLASRFATRLERHGSRFTTVDLEETANAHPFSRRGVFEDAAVSEPYRVWHEAEHAATYEGGDGPVARAAAAGGQVLGAAFGTEEEHFAVYEFATPRLPEAHLYLRAARPLSAGTERPSRWQLFLDGRPLGQIEIPPTDGQGDEDRHFRWVHVELGELLAGGHTLRLESAAADGETLFDGFYIAAGSFQPPTSGAAEILTRDAVEQVPYRAARRVMEGVPFQFIDPERNDGRGIVLVRGRDAPADRGASEVAIPVPAGDADLIHFCGQVGGPRHDLVAHEPVAEYELQFEDGQSERILLTAGDIVRPAWAGLSVLTHELPPERRLERVIVRGRHAGVATALAAVTLEHYPPGGPNHHLLGSGLFHGVRAHGIIAAADFEPAENEPAMHRRIALGPGDTTSINIVMAMGENLPEAERTAHAWETLRDPLAHHQRTFQAWFDENCPQFACDDPFITRLYWYRWFVARHNLSRARTGNLPEPYFFEGTRRPHFARLVAFSSPHIIAETRWLRDPQYARGQVHNHGLNADDDDHFFISARIDEKGGHYTNWISRAAWELFWVHPDIGWLRDVLRSLGSDVLGTLRRFDHDQDALPAPESHWTTGMEFQPSFFYFNDYDNTLPAASLKRPDFAAYVYGNARAVAEAYAFVGLDDEAARFNAIARRIRQAALSKMWDEHDRFFYAVRERDDALARVREIVGFYPFMTRLAPDEPRYTRAFAYLIDPGEFWTPFPPATVTQHCPAYTPRVAHWPAAGGRTHGCMWNGPTWPHASSVILDAVAAAVQDYDDAPVSPRHFWHLFERYTRLHFEDGDLERPYLTEYYDGETGEPMPDGCPDYFHSTYNDLVIRYLVGLQPTNTERLVLRPIPGPLNWFSLRRVRYRGHDVDIVYNGGDGPGPLGLTVWIDGRWAAHRPNLGRLVVDLPARQKPKPEPPPQPDIYGDLHSP